MRDAKNITHASERADARKCTKCASPRVVNAGRVVAPAKDSYRSQPCDDELLNVLLA